MGGGGIVGLLGEGAGSLSRKAERRKLEALKAFLLSALLRK